MSFDSVSQHLPSYLGFSYLGRWVSPHGLLRNLSAGQEATVRTGHATTDWFQIGKAVRQVCILSPCLFNLYAVYIMRNAGLEEAQAGIKMPGAASRSWAGRQIGCVHGRGRMCPGGWHMPTPDLRWGFQELGVCQAHEGKYPMEGPGRQIPQDICRPP